MTETTRLDSRTRRRHRRTVVLAAIFAFAAALVAGWMLKSWTARADSEGRRADQAVAAAEQACQQLIALGYPCPFDPKQLRGDPGPVGPAGPLGPAGMPGQNGADGLPGAVGPSGVQGADGEQGVTGPVGPAGPQGPEGPQGPTGVAGPAGAQCPAGTHAELVDILTSSGIKTAAMCIQDPPAN